MKKLRVLENSTHAEIFRNNKIAISFHNAITMVHTSTSILQKALGNISNHHILMTETSSSY
jgi:hypothetical protein